MLSLTIKDNFMRTLNVFYVTALCGVLTLSGCSEEVMNLSMPEPHEGQLRVRTRGEGDEALQSRLYVFDGAGQCVAMLSPDDNEQFVTADLSSGSYDLYGIGSDDLSNFVLPNADDATPTTAIAVAAGKQMGDLLIGHEKISLADGDHENLNIQLERKVTCVTRVTIHEVPDDVEQVKVSVSPMYRQLLLNGSYGDATGAYTISLTDQGAGDWEAEPHEMILPSDKLPEITISFIKGEDVNSYSYTAPLSFKANNNVSVEGTFVGLQGVELTATLTSQSWEATPRDISFDFDELPLVGQMYQGYFVVATDPENRIATLLSAKGVGFTAPAKSDQTSWLTTLNAAMNSYAKPSFAAADDHWRLPTLEECGVFSKNTDFVMSFSPEGLSGIYFCLDGSTLKGARSKQTEQGVVLLSDQVLSEKVKLRPVIDIRY